MTIQDNAVPDNGGRLSGSGEWGRRGPRGARVDRRRRLSESRPVEAPHYTELVGHGPAELAAIVAARHGWRLTGREVLLDEHGKAIACTIAKAGTAMRTMGWFDGDENGELWIDWMMTPRTSAAAADAVRAWLAANDPAERSRLAF